MPSESGYSGSLRAATRAPGRVTRRACARTRSASLRLSACCLRAVPAASSAERCGASGALATQTSTVDARAAVRENSHRRGRYFRTRCCVGCPESAGKKRARDSRTTRRFRRIAKRIDLLLAKSPFGLSDAAASFFVSRKTRAARLAREFLFFAICLVARDRSIRIIAVLFRRDGDSKKSLLHRTRAGERRERDDEERVTRRERASASPGTTNRIHPCCHTISSPPCPRF